MAGKNSKLPKMQQRKKRQSLLIAFSGRQFRPTVIILSSLVLMLTWKYYGSVSFFRESLAGSFDLPSDAASQAAAAATYSFLSCFVLLGVIPALIVKLVFRQRLSDYGVQFGDRLRTIRSFALMAPFLILIAYSGSGEPAVAAEYPINRGVLYSPQMFAFHAVTYLFFYLGWEFHFRGFLQFGLQEKLGRVNSLLVQVLASSLLHIGKPDIESFSAIVAGIVWGIVAYRTRSILSGTLQHYTLGILLDWFIIRG